MLPNFLIIGAMKAGTDSLYEYLRRHPLVFMSDTKELNYFAKDLNWGLGQDWYESQFAAGNGARAIGEASTSYSKYPDHSGVPERIANRIPEAKLIYLVRNPVDRIRSQYLHMVLHGREKDPIDVAVLKDPSYLNFSRYGLQIDQYLECFPSEQILVVLSDDLKTDRLRTVNRVLEFLGLEGGWDDPDLGREFHITTEKRVLRPTFRRLARMPGYRRVGRMLPEGVKRMALGIRTRGVDPDAAKVSSDVREYIHESLKTDLKRLRDYLGDDFDGWGIA